MPQISVWIPKEELKKIDLFCKEKGKSRSEALRKALLYLINKPANLK